MSFFSWLQSKNPWRSKAAPAPTTGFAGYLARQRIPLEQVSAPPEEGPKWSEEQLAGLEQHLEQPNDALDGFLHFGLWLPVESSNVDAIHYDGEVSKLEIRYKNGNYYEYSDVSIREAEAFAKANSAGGWVWTNLRRRGPGGKFGWRKPYRFLSGISAGAPQWMRSSGTRALHGHIGPHGAPNKSVMKRLMPKGFKRGSKMFQPHTFPTGRKPSQG